MKPEELNQIKKIFEQAERKERGIPQAVEMTFVLEAAYELINEIERLQKQIPETISCPVCLGMGYLSSILRNNCYRCSGTGRIPHDEYKI